MTPTTTSTSALNRPSVRPQGANVITIASGKGGVGKTWLAITLSHALAKGGRKALLFDGDVGLANVDIQLGLTPGRDLGAVIAGRLKLTDAITAYGDGGFDIVAGRSGSGNLATLHPARLTTLHNDLVSLARRYDDVVVDLGAGVEHAVRQLTTGSGRCLVVCTDEPTSLTDAYAFIKIIRLERPALDLRIVVNGASSVREGEQTYKTLRKACENFLKFAPRLGVIVPRDGRVKDSIRNQTPILVRHPGCPAAVAIEKLATALADEG